MNHLAPVTCVHDREMPAIQGSGLEGSAIQVSGLEGCLQFRGLD